MSIFDTPIGEIEERKYAPVGKYLGTLTKYSMGQSAQKGTPFVEMEFKVLEGLSGQDLEGVDLKTAKFAKKFYVTEDSKNILFETLAKLLGKEEVKGLTPNEALEQSVGRPVQFVVELGKPNPNTGKQYKEITRFFEAA